ncbi:hypothetical protein [Gallibacterium genomosp. 1]|uniref:hypothetical protein n=1 Tax=Gallibacterium genomosp. 1 TaxID=155515 RepID=UPI0008026A59|nr:hypothetical protein [Gallibacterium genomosp. 1]OBW98950.1 hypothetical protein QV04_08790 [Gallibacterium genomosp. 1]
MNSKFQITSISILTPIFAFILAIFIIIFSTQALAEVPPNSFTNKPFDSYRLVDIQVISQNIQKQDNGKLMFSTTYLIKNKSSQNIKKLAWYAVFIFNNRIIDNRLSHINFKQFNILKPNQQYYLIAFTPEDEMPTFSKELFTSDSSDIKVKPIIKSIVFDDGSTSIKHN